MSVQVSLSAAGEGLTGGNTALPSSFVIQAPAGVKQGDLEVSVVGPNGKAVSSTLTPQDNGEYVVTYQAEIEGEHSVNFVIKSSFSVAIAVGTDSSKSRAYGPGLEEGVQDTLPTNFTIEARGTDGEPIKKGGDPFVVKVTGPNGDVPATITDNGDGTYNVEYAPEDAGDHTIEVSLNDKPVDRSPYTINVAEGADFAKSTIEGFHFVIQARSKRGNNLAVGGQTFAVKASGPTRDIEVTVDDLNNGLYHVKYVFPDDAPGTYKLVTEVNGKSIKGSPFEHTY